VSGELVSVAGLSGGYGGERLVLRDVTFALRAGESLAVLGPNGGGKTTLFRALLGELPVRRGHVAVAARPAYVPQGERTRLDFPVSALDVALMGAYGRTRLLRRVGRADRRLAARALDRVGMAEQAGTRFGTLSGGQRQRVLIARALVQDVAVLLLDEPLSGVDGVSAQRIRAVFDELRAEGRALLVATHDIAHGRDSDRVLCLNGRQVAFGTPAGALTMEALEQTYGGDIVRIDGGRLMTVEHHHGHEHG
jgi:manganese/iron transport system ATP-binding protein/manganese/zinc/iron transport system ATP- binding protein